MIRGSVSFIQDETYNEVQQVCHEDLPNDLRKWHCSPASKRSILRGEREGTTLLTDHTDSPVMITCQMSERLVAQAKSSGCMQYVIL